MVFTSLEFLFYFLPITLAVYLAAPKTWRNGVLLAASLVFYLWGGGVFVFILVTSIIVDYFACSIVARGRIQGLPRLMRTGITLSVVVNLALLAYFKYANFAIEQLNGLGFGEIAWNSIALPIGISFFTFQSMSYTIDVARGRAKHMRNPVDFAVYVASFPQLIAGPIVRYHEIADQLKVRKTTIDGFAEGAVRFIHGVVKKVVIADGVAIIADAAFAVPDGQVTWSVAWIGTLAYTIQIYFDFSGYSDMAIGLGRMLGFTIPENFRRPYSAVSITDFWRRWHITLSNWFRDYLYFPLGGSRGSKSSTYRNLVIVFLLTGLWHGASWTFVAWGAYHGALLTAERITRQRPTGDGSVPFEPLRRAVVLLAVMVGWVLFRADSFSQAATFLKAMFFSVGGEIAPTLSPALNNRNSLILVLGLAVVLLPRRFVGGSYVARGSGLRPALARLAVVGIGLPYAAVLIAAGTFSPFLYFRF